MGPVERWVRPHCSWRRTTSPLFARFTYSACPESRISEQLARIVFQSLHTEDPSVLQRPESLVEPLLKKAYDSLYWIRNSGPTTGLPIKVLPVRNCLRAVASTGALSSGNSVGNDPCASTVIGTRAIANNEQRILISPDDRVVSSEASRDINLKQTCKMLSQLTFGEVSPGSLMVQYPQLEGIVFP